MSAAAPDAAPGGACRVCRAPLRHTLVDLGVSPLCESYIPAERLDVMEPHYPLHAYVCDGCWLVQVREYVRPEAIFTEYAYFSSYSDSWLAHAAAYVDRIVPRLGLGPGSLVVEVGSNDGYLLQYLVARGIPALGVEPARNVAAAATERGIPTIVDMFGRRAAQALVAAGRRADLLIGNNVLAQVPDLDDFVAGLALALAPGGVLTLEFQHLLRLLEESQFDTIYHEHFSYFSLGTAARVLAAHGLAVFDVEELPTHGGSLRVYAERRERAGRPASDRVPALLARERAAGLECLDAYAGFRERVHEAKRALLEFLIGARRAGKRVAGYGAPGKGNTLLNFCGIGTDLVECTVDRNPYKQGKFLPGSRIPIFAPEHIAATRPDYLLILPWNLREEIMGQMAGIRAWGGQFVVPIPRVAVYP
ncbi:MAG TPA: class I SAM-dependent methyltransferase [Methylomirabilota bacterium]|jgi:SAM-dependent methyltransferase